MNYFEDIKKDWVPDSQGDVYYSIAEAPEAVRIFWGENTAFHRMFRTLDRSFIVELACGHGRHTEYMLNALPVGTAVLMDFVAGNIEFCEKRLARYENAKFLQNGGDNFLPLGTGQATAIFCYDAMVHFEYDTVFSYLRDAARVLRVGGRALFHHSNYTGAPGGIYRNNPHWRNFMSKELFAHVAMRFGFRVVEQSVLQWGTTPSLDCLTLLEKL